MDAEMLKHLKLAGRTGTASILPFEAVRFQLTLENGSQREIGPLPLLEGATYLKTVAKGGRTVYSVPEAFNTAFTVPDHYEDVNPPPLYYLVQHQQLMLKPGEKDSLTLAVAADWAGATPKFLFGEPGEYTVTFVYLWLPIEIRVVVRKPEGADARVCRMLEGDPELRAILAHPHAFRAPPEKVLRSLETIVLRYPKSAYADYARFALARVYLQRIRYPERAEEADRTAAAALLDSAAAEFPYAPNATLVLMKITDDAAKAAKCRTRLGEQFRDAREWVIDQMEKVIPGPASMADDEDVLAEKLKAQGIPKLRGPRTTVQQP